MTFRIITVGKEIINGRLKELQRHLRVKLSTAAAGGAAATAAAVVVVIVVVSTVDLPVVESLEDGWMDRLLVTVSE